MASAMPPKSSIRFTPRKGVSPIGTADVPSAGVSIVRMKKWEATQLLAQTIPFYSDLPGTDFGRYSDC
jgi:hypothetical protein